MKTFPIVSVIVPCFNQGLYIKDALDSVLVQNLNDWECIIVNDGSNDNSERVALEYCKLDERFKYINKENGGISSARNTGIENAFGKYILPLDADDVIEPSYLEKAITVFEEDPRIKLVYCKGKMFGHVNKEWIMHPFSYKELLKGHNMIFASSVFRKEDFKDTGGYRENMKYGWEDWDFWVNFLSNCEANQVHRIDEYLFFYRIKEASRSVTIDGNKGLQDQMLNQSFKNNIDIYIQHYPDLFKLIMEQDYNISLLNKAVVKFGVKLHFLIENIKKKLSR